MLISILKLKSNLLRTFCKIVHANFDLVVELWPIRNEHFDSLQDVITCPCLQQQKNKKKTLNQSILVDQNII